MVWRRRSPVFRWRSSIRSFRTGIRGLNERSTELVADLRRSGRWGAAGGETLLYTGSPVLAGAANGFVTNGASQILANANGSQDGYDLGQLGGSTALGAATGLLPGGEFEGINAGRGSYNSIFKQITTKAANGTISNITWRTAGKMFIGANTDAGNWLGTPLSSLAGNLIGSSNLWIHGRSGGSQPSNGPVCVSGSSNESISAK